MRHRAPNRRHDAKRVRITTEREEVRVELDATIDCPWAAAAWTPPDGQAQAFDVRCVWRRKLQSRQSWALQQEAESDISSRVWSLSGRDVRVGPPRRPTRSSPGRPRSATRRATDEAAARAQSTGTAAARGASHPTPRLARTRTQRPTPTMTPTSEPTISPAARACSQSSRSDPPSHARVATVVRRADHHLLLTRVTAQHHAPHRKHAAGRACTQRRRTRRAPRDATPSTRRSSHAPRRR